MGINSISVSNTCINLIHSIIKPGSVILELGSGEGTVILAEFYTMYSIENQPEWYDRYPICTTYINTRTRMYDDTYLPPDIPENKGWYHTDDLIGKLPEKYDLILIDGPGGAKYGRGGFVKHIDLFNTNVPMIFDDVHRENDLMVMQKVSEIVNRPYHIHEQDKSLGYIL